MPAKGVPRRSPKEAEASYVQAYWNWRDGMSLSENAAALAEQGHPCSARGTLTGKDGWINRGRKIESMRGGPLAKEQAQREMVAAAYNSLRVKLEQEITRGSVPRIHGRRLQADLLTRYAQLLGLPAPTRARIDVTGDDDAPRFPPALDEALAGLPVDELLDALQLPHREADR